MKITDVNSYVVVPDYGSLTDVTDEWQWTFVTIDTDERCNYYCTTSCNLMRHMKKHKTNQSK